ncbi:MAG: immunoglobulin-like domain-containing protein [Bacteroidota bacterium]
MKLFLKYAKLVPVFIMTAFLVGCGDDEGDDNLPQVIAGFTQTIDQSTSTVTFINTSENAERYVWDFGDSTTSTEINPTKSYLGGDYTVTLTASNTAGAEDMFEDTFTIIGGTPVITLNGQAIISVRVGDTFSDPGATAMDDEDGDISSSIVVAGDVVDTSVEDTYVITYNVTDSDGNASAEVTRTVNVEADPFDSGLLTNGNFEAGVAPWLAGVETTPAPVVTENGNTFYSVTVTNPDSDQPFLVNLSQKLPLTMGESYTVTFDAWSDRARTIIVGVGRSGGDFANVVETVNITDTRTTYTATFVNIGFGEADNRVLFDSNAEAGLVNIDDVSLVVADGDLTAPDITLIGDATINLEVGDMFTDPGATANDDVDGDISSSIVVAGDMVDTNTEGTYVITYNVMDAAGNSAAEVTRTVIVTAPVVFCNTQIQAFGGDTGSDIFISVFNVDTQTMRIEIESADDDPVDNLVFPAGDWNPVPGISSDPADQGNGVWAGEFFFGSGAPENVEFNILWSKVSFAGNWSQNEGTNLSTVPFNNTCGSGSGNCPGEPVAATMLPLDFEGCESFINAFASAENGVVPSLDDNPSKSGINTSDFVLKVVKANGINRWGGIQNSFPAGVIDITTQVFKIKVYSSVSDVTYRFELALDPQTDPVTGNPPPVFRQVSGGANTWTEIEFTFTGLPATPTTYNQLVIKPDNPDGSDGETTSEERTFYFDDLRLENP